MCYLISYANTPKSSVLSISNGWMLQLAVSSRPKATVRSARPNFVLSRRRTEGESSSIRRRERNHTVLRRNDEMPYGKRRISNEMRKGDA